MTPNCFAHHVSQILPGTPHYRVELSPDLTIIKPLVNDDECFHEAVNVDKPKTSTSWFRCCGVPPFPPILSTTKSFLGQRNKQFSQMLVNTTHPFPRPLMLSYLGGWTMMMKHYPQQQ